jgi:hypothetical protein
MVNQSLMDVLVGCCWRWRLSCEKDLSEVWTGCYSTYICRGIKSKIILMIQGAVIKKILHTLLENCHPVVRPSYPRTKKLVWPHSDLGPPRNTPWFAGQPIFPRSESPKQLGHVTCRCWGVNNEYTWRHNEHQWRHMRTKPADWTLNDVIYVTIIFLYVTRFSYLGPRTLVPSLRGCSIFY